MFLERGDVVAGKEGGAGSGMMRRSDLLMVWWLLLLPGLASAGDGRRPRLRWLVDRVGADPWRSGQPGVMSERVFLVDFARIFPTRRKSEPG